MFQLERFNAWAQDLIKEDNPTQDIVSMAISEMIGSAILVLVGCSSYIGTFDFEPSSLTVSVVFGFAHMLCMQCFSYTRELHINPAITVGALIFGKMSLILAGIFVIAQCIGSIIGYGLLKVIVQTRYMRPKPSYTMPVDLICVTQLNDNISVGEGFLVEILATFLLTSVACGIWDKKNSENTDSVPIRFGFSVIALCLAFEPYTGCGINPARSLAPAIWNNKWSYHWIYWLGPLVGASCAATLYRYCLAQEEMPMESIAEETTPETNQDLYTENVENA
ncbi:aquaporin-like [Orussus abietinus]|uniref:aquaporin-like n=1 Tax=Orussus abietinus TaxID=222816 RepID=UPI000626375C|nr:aquaporin-like [Orussus abietinus]